MVKYVALFLLAVPAATIAQTPTAAPQAPIGAKKNPLDKIICRTEDTIGTRLGAHKVCATLREWKDQEEENREAVDRAQRNTDQTPSG